MGFRILRTNALFAEKLKFSINSYKLYAILLYFLLTLRQFFTIQVPLEGWLLRTYSLEVVNCKSRYKRMQRPIWNSYTFCGGPDDSSFSIEGDSLKTTTIYSSEIQKSYSICIRSTDAYKASITKTFVLLIKEGGTTPPSLETKDPTSESNPTPVSDQDFWDAFFEFFNNLVKKIFR